MNFPSYIAGRPVYSDDKLEVYYPWDNTLTGTVSRITRPQLDEAIEAALEGGKNPLSRYERHAILRKAAELLAEHREELAKLICRETGLCLRETMCSWSVRLPLSIIPLTRLRIRSLLPSQPALR